MICTPLTKDMRPVYPVNCPICGAFLGAMYKEGLSLKAWNKPCTERCMKLWKYGRGKRNWRELPSDLRQIYLAAGLLENEATTRLTRNT